MCIRDRALSADIQGSAEKIQETGIFAKAAVAAKAIPNCNICFIDGADMQSALAAFYEVMYSLAPDSIGGSIPAPTQPVVRKAPSASSARSGSGAPRAFSSDESSPSRKVNSRMRSCEG